MEQLIDTGTRSDNPHTPHHFMAAPITASGSHPAIGAETRPPRRAWARPRTATDSAPWPYLFVKRMVDIVAALFFLALGFLPLLILCVCVALESPGPFIYKRRVLAQQAWTEDRGEEGLKTFDAYKLRTMVSNAEEVLRQNPHLMAMYSKDWKLENDPRITRLGRFLRTTSIDEFPQLLNVLKGEMTLIGPRMITAPELARYGEDAPRLLQVKSGLTGLWQVSGRQNVSYDERVRLDMTYIDSRSFLLDCRILFKTIWCVLRREGAC